ncbi:hypothetical protein Slin15195_G071450 [Septoria linicola]|uniref:Uncharacterized protein n=1 Tax=Septoria linicola TaxID=215465 RepID=A0A9Q9AXX7_9PEZI|nr:hypothetical protein Slin14017_G104200 [Septoria linicola]USW53826.1 hypothetical protein Slin15195_G071450 [Septoria linicola]
MAMASQGPQWCSADTLLKSGPISDTPGTTAMGRFLLHCGCPDDGGNATTNPRTWQADLPLLTNRRKLLRHEFASMCSPCTTKSKHTVVKTVTPKVYKTTTKTSYTTITNPYKDTSTVVETVTKGATTVTTSTSISTAVTTVSSTSTSNVPAPAGFTPILESLPGSSFTEDDVGSPGKTYPKQVTCHKYTSDKKCAIKKVTVTKTSTAKPYTHYSTKKVVKTTTECPKAKATVTSKTTITTTSTSTAQTSSVTTSTSTSFVSTTTVYAACVSNLADRVNGERLASLATIPDERTFDPVLVDANSALECCNRAFQAQDPAIACLLATSPHGICPAEQSTNTFVVKNTSQEAADPSGGAPPFPQNGPPTLGNGACGLIIGPQAA